ncbi:MAG: holo-[acyl-carrier protein] synthase [Pseudohongiellaceae bacterium]|jgi:holo-[acyl-carrier protein] synthase
MIIGIGTDMIKVARIEATYQRLGDKFAQRILSQGEYESFKVNAKPMALLAKRFAAKEAAGKALGTGIGQGVSWQDIYIEHDNLGAPLLKMCGKAAEYAEKKGVKAMHVSISDEEDIAMAFVILEG